YVPAGGDGGVLSIPGSNKGLSFTVDGNGRYCYLDPYLGAVKTQLLNIMEKLHLSNRSQAAVRATELFDESIERAEKAYIACLEAQKEVLE
ncbi:unnamed protein product, partial [marine sediment metagenome]